MIEAAEPTDCRPTLADVHISDAEDSHPNITSPLKMQIIEPEPPLNDDQLLQKLSSMRVQMKNHKLSIRADAKPVKQKPKRMNEERNLPSGLKSITYSRLASFEKHSTPTDSLIPSS